jgi:type VI secretion system protein ImpF
VAELAPKERIQPSLLDRLTDDEPEKKRESADKRVLTVERLGEYVRRDIGFLLNSTHLAAVQDLGDYPEVERSTLNYGIPDFAGRTASTVDRAALAKSIRRAILEFEPRLLRKTVRVEVVVEGGQEGKHSPNALRFHIEADLWCQPVPLRMYLRTDLNLEDGEARVTQAVPL